MSLDKFEALNQANQYILQRNVPAAVEVYRKIIEADPTDLTAITTLGDLYSSEGRAQDAIAQFARVAAMYADAGFTRKAIEALKKIIAVDPANIETAIKLADLYAEAGLPSEARHHYLQIAEALTRKGQMLDALSVYNKIVDLDPLNTSGRIKLAELYLREGMSQQAYEAFVTAAEQLAAGSENRRALSAYKEALAIRPDSVEVRAAARKVATLLGVNDPDKSSRNSTPQSPDAVGLAAGDSPAQVPPEAPSDSSSHDQAPQSADSFVVQEISKAEILVAYGQVNKAISMLRNVLREQPDSVELHIKLKDIYLRTGMMAEAAFEYAELERIHDARGESERARDYAVRASRLTQLLEQPSGDLPEPKRKQLDVVEHRVADVPAQVASAHASNSRRVVSTLEAPPAERNRMTISVLPSEELSKEVATIPAPDWQALEQKFVEAPASLGVAELVSAQPTEAALVLSTEPRVSALPVLFASSMPVKSKRTRLTAAAVAGSVLALLGVSAVIGGFAYNSHLEKQYQALALAIPPIAIPLPPAVPDSDEPPPLLENDPIAVVVRPSVQTDGSAQPSSPEPEAIRNEAPSPPQPVSEPAKVTTRPSPVPPRMAFTPDNRAGTENQTPVGVPVDVPIGATHSAEPPPKAVRQSPGVVLGGTVKRVDPVYPSSARAARLVGAVAVEVMINEQGNVTSARALSGPALLRDAAVGAARAWKFRASTLGGVPVPTTTTIVFNFKL